MTLGEIIEYLKKKDPNKQILIGLACPHSYRGFYEQLAFEPDGQGMTIAECLVNVKWAVDQTYDGYKGGKFKMTLDTDVHIAYYGKYGIELTKSLLDFFTEVYEG